MEKVSRFTNDFQFCYSIREENPLKFFEKALLANKYDDSLLELRVDYMLANGIDIKKIVSVIDDINKNISGQRLIITIRTIEEGGKISLSDEDYYEYIGILYNKTNSKYIDVEYEYYIKNPDKYRALFSGNIKRVIASKHIFDGALKNDEYKRIFLDMAKSNVNIVKFAIMLDNKEELFDYMLVARECSKLIENGGKNCVFIAMGEIGQLSRLWPEFTNTKIVFLTMDSKKANKIGQLSYENYVKYRKLLEKIDKN